MRPEEPKTRPRWLNPTDDEGYGPPDAQLSWWERTKAKIKSPQFEDSLWDGLDHAVRVGCLHGCFVGVSLAALSLVCVAAAIRCFF